MYNAILCNYPFLLDVLVQSFIKGLAFFMAKPTKNFHNFINFFINFFLPLDRTRLDRKFDPTLNGNWLTISNLPKFIYWLIVSIFA